MLLTRRAYWLHNPTAHKMNRPRESVGCYLRKQDDHDVQKYEHAERG